MTWVGSARLSHEAQKVYDSYILLKNFGIKPWETNETGEAYKEDLVYMIALENFVNEAQRKWNNSSDAGSVKVRR